MEQAELLRAGRHGRPLRLVLVPARGGERAEGLQAGAQLQRGPFSRGGEQQSDRLLIVGSEGLRAVRDGPEQQAERVDVTALIVPDAHLLLARLHHLGCLRHGGEGSGSRQWRPSLHSGGTGGGGD